MITNALSVDVEEYYHAAIFRRGTNGRGPRHFESRVEESVDRLLALLGEHHARATFFVLGEVAALHPAMVRTIAAAGHEIGCHSDRHEDVSAQSPHEFRADTRRAKARIEDAVGEAVVGYRAPNFSIGPAQSWAYQVLLEEGFRYDSSTHPIVHDRYGQPDAPRFPHEIYRDGSASLTEFPIGTVRLLGLNLPIGGGGFFRLLPAGGSWTRGSRGRRWRGGTGFATTWASRRRRPSCRRSWVNSSSARLAKYSSRRSIRRDASR